VRAEGLDSLERTRVLHLPGTLQVNAWIEHASGELKEVGLLEAVRPRGVEWVSPETPLSRWQTRLERAR